MVRFYVPVALLQTTRSRLWLVAKQFARLSYHDHEIASTNVAFLSMKYIRVIDSHTGGEPTRIVYEGGPDLGDGPLADRLNRLRSQFDDFRSAVVNEPRGNDVIVGGLVCQPHDPTCQVGVIFFNNIGYLGMCGHGTIGLLVTLDYLQRIKPGVHRIDTPVGPVTAELKGKGEVTVCNVSSFRFRKDVEIEVDGVGTVRGDVAWGGNWFFLIKNSEEVLSNLSLSLTMADVDRLQPVSLRIRDALEANGVTGREGAWIDHLEWFGPPQDPQNDSRNFVLCPGGAYDRSPCGTGTSAKLACLAADGKLKPGEYWRQESIVGSLFVGSYEMVDDPQCHDSDLGSPVIVPSITGTAYVGAEATLILDPNDPFCMGIER